MYSVVLLAAMTAGGQTSAHGCCNWGGCYGGCYGNYGVDSYNCYGGGYGGRYGGCYGGCWGGHTSCYGGYSCCGGYSCGGYWGGYSCSGGYPWDWSSAGCSGTCWGAYGEVASPYFVQPPPAVTPPPMTKPGEPVPPPSKPGEPVPPPSKPGETLPPPNKPGEAKPPEAVAPNRARLIVDLPPDAKLYVDDTAMKSPSDHRTFQTPDLEPGQTYYYELRVEVQRDGRPVSETKRVLVRAGQEIHADFSGITTTSTAQAK